MITEDQKHESCILLNKLKILINEATILNNINDLYTDVEEVFTDFSKSISDSISETKEKLVEVSTKRTEEIEQSLETLKKDVKNAITSASEGFESTASGSSSSSGDAVDDTTTSSSITTPPSGITASGVDAETAKSVFEELAIGINEAIAKNNNSIKTALENVTTGIEESIDETLPTTFDKISKTWYEAKRDLIIDEINKTLNELSTKIQYNI